MKWETVIAILLGVVVGGTLAFYLATKSSALTKASESNVIATSEAALQESSSSSLSQNAGFSVTSHKAGDLMSGKNVTIKGIAPTDALLVIQTPVFETVRKVKDSAFSVDVTLAKGENMIHITAYHKNLPVGVSSITLPLYVLPQ